MRAVPVAVAIAILFACGGNIPPFDEDLIWCLATCQDGTCVKTDEGAWVCVPEPPPPPPEPQCGEDDQCDCYDETEWIECGGPDPCDACLPHQACVGGVCVGPPDARPICNRPPENRKCDCWNKPLGPSEWEWLECQTPPPPPKGCGPPEQELVPVDAKQQEKDNADAVAAGIKKLGPRTHVHPQESLRQLAKLIRDDNGWCAFGGKEAVFIIRKDDLWDEYHAVDFGNNGTGWTNNDKGKWIGRHEDQRRTAEGLRYPDPRLWSIRFNVHNEPARNRIDTTGTVYSALDFCLAIRMGTHGDQPRAACPVRPEGHRDRPAWESLVFGAQRHWCNGEPMEWWQGNSAVAKGVCHGRYKTCSEDMQYCTEVDLP